MPAGVSGDILGPMTAGECSGGIGTPSGFLFHHKKLFRRKSTPAGLFYMGEGKYRSPAKRTFACQADLLSETLETPHLVK